MAVKVLCLLLMLLVGTIDAENDSKVPRKPLCGNGEEILACPLNLAPVCGSDGNTYANECVLCVQRQATRANILIVNDESC